MLEKSLPIVAQAMGRKMGVKVAIGGSHARTNGETIHLPDLPEDGREAAVLAHGFLDHEAAHVRLSDMEAFTGFARRSRLHKEVLNIVEDLRIEGEMGRIYPGVRINLAKLNEHLVSDDRFTGPTPDTHPAQLVLGYLLYRGFVRTQGLDALRELADQAEQYLRGKVGGALVDDLDQLLDEVPGLESTAEAAELAQRILDRLHEEADHQDDSSPDSLPDQGEGEDGDDAGGSAGPDSQEDGEEGQGEPQSPEADGDDQADDAGEGDSQAGGGDDPETEGDSEAADDSNAEDDPDGKGGAGGDGDPEADEAGGGQAGSPSEDDGEGEPQAAGEEADGEGGTPTGSGEEEADADDGGTKANAPQSQPDSEGHQKSQPGNGDEPSQAQAAQVASEALEGDPEGHDWDLGELAGRRLEELAGDLDPGEWVKVAEWTTPNPGHLMPADRTAVRSATRGLRTRLQGLIQASRMDRPAPKRTGRGVDSRRLHRLAAGDPRVFSRRRHRRAPNTAVHILMDMSSSMGPSRVLASHAALAVSEALSGIPGVATAVTAFPGPRPEISVSPIKGYDENLAATAAKAWDPGWNGMTPTAGALWAIAPGLLNRPEERRLVIVATDGYPEVSQIDDHVHARQTRAIIDRMTTSGIEVVGLGIGHMAVEDLFPDHRVIQGVEELAKALFEMLEQRLAA